MALIGYSYQVPNFFGKSIMVEHIVAEDFRHREIIVSKEIPIAFFLIEENPMADIDGIPFIYLPLLIDLKEHKIQGYTIAQYLTRSNTNIDIIKDKFTKDTIGFCQQIYFTDKNIIGLTQFFDIRFEDDFVYELHANPIFLNEPLTRFNPSKPSNNNDISMFVDTNSYKTYYKNSPAYQREIDMKSRLSSVFPEDRCEILNQYLELNNCPISELVYSKSSSLHIDFEYEIHQRLFNGQFWLTKKQEEINFKEWKSTAPKPVITYEDKIKFSTYAENWDYFFPTNMEWSGNFNGNMCALSTQINKEDNKLHVYFSGTDDCDMGFSTPFNCEIDFILFLVHKFNGLITYDNIDEVGKFCEWLDY